MSEDMLHKHETRNSRLKLFFIAFALIGGFFLIAEHQAHVLPYLPWLLLGGCVFMHMFMHGGHSHGGNAPRGVRSAGLIESSVTTPPVDTSHRHGERPS